MHHNVIYYAQEHFFFVKLLTAGLSKINGLQLGWAVRCLKQNLPIEMTSSRKTLYLFRFFSFPMKWPLGLSLSKACEALKLLGLATKALAPNTKKKENEIPMVNPSATHYIVT
jgi:hypothetical protein